MTTPIPDMYYVKWYDRQKNKWCYGVADRYSPASIQYYNDGQQIIVDDAVTPDRYVLNVDALTDIRPTFNPLDEYHEFLERERNAAITHSRSLPAGMHVGKMFTTPVGDGCAYYVVTKVNKKTVDIEWRGYSPDRWVDFRFGCGGGEKRELIGQMVHREEAMGRLFSSQRVAT